MIIIINAYNDVESVYINQGKFMKALVLRVFVIAVCFFTSTQASDIHFINEYPYPIKVKIKIVGAGKIIGINNISVEVPAATLLDTVDNEKVTLPGELKKNKGGSCFSGIEYEIQQTPPIKGYAKRTRGSGCGNWQIAFTSQGIKMK